MFIQAMFSCDHFGGYQATLEIQKDNSLEEIIALAVSNLYDELQKLSLKSLVSILNEKQYHVHNISIQDLEPGAIVYICGHHSIQPK
jgi:hypothetical protein